MTGSGKFDAFFFYAGNAIKALQTAHRLDKDYAAIPAAATDKKLAALKTLQEAIDLLTARTVLLEKLAEVGPNEWCLKGTDAEGWFLLTSVENAQRLRAQMEVIDQNERALSEPSNPDDTGEDTDALS